MNPFRSSEDKEVLIESSEAETETENAPLELEDASSHGGRNKRHRQQKAYVEVPLSCPLEVEASPIKTPNSSHPLDQYPDNDDDEYEDNPRGKVTFQQCSEYLSENYRDKRFNEETSSTSTSWRNNFIVRRTLRIVRLFGNVTHVLKFHKKFLISSLFTTVGSSGCLIFFPLHLENISGSGRSDGYAACFIASTITMLIFLFYCILLELMRNFRKSHSESVLYPLLQWKSMGKVGFCLGLSFTTIFYSWEDDKVPCNFQDPLLGLVIIFAIITHAVTKWRRIGLKRAFSLSAIAAGVFLSVDYPLVDHHRCRGYYYRNQISELWTWKVHLVWTLAFVVSIWLATVAAFFLESSVPVPKVKHSRLYDLEYNAVKLRVMKAASAEASRGVENNHDDGSEKHLKSYKYSPYVHFHVGLVANAVLWFSISTWIFILSLFWTEFIPGFGKGISVKKLPDKIMTGFISSLSTGSSWALFISLFIFSHAFTYLTVLTRSPIVGISVAMLGFPIIGLWWSFFQIKYSLFVWMPVFSGELICAFLGLITVFTGCYYFIKFEILKPAKIKNEMYAHYF